MASLPAVCALLPARGSAGVMGDSGASRLPVYATALPASRHTPANTVMTRQVLTNTRNDVTPLHNGPSATTERNLCVVSCWAPRHTTAPITAARRTQAEARRAGVTGEAAAARPTCRRGAHLPLARAVASYFHSLETFRTS